MTHAGTHTVGSGCRGCHSSSGCQHGITERSQPGPMKTCREVFPYNRCKPCIRVGPERKLYKARSTNWRRTLLGRAVAQQQAFFWCWWIHQLMSIVIAGSTITTEGHTKRPGPGQGLTKNIYGNEALGEALAATLPAMQGPAAVSNASTARLGEGSLALWMLVSLQNGDKKLYIVIGRDSPFMIGIKSYMDLLVKQLGISKGVYWNGNYGMECVTTSWRALSRLR